MNTVTDGLKRTMAERHNNHPYPKHDKTNLHRKEDIYEQKFMSHFETINKTPNITQQQSNATQNQEITFKKTLIDYSSKASPIDAITSIEQDAIHIVHSQIPLVVAPIIPGLKASSLQTIKIIKDMFVGISQKENNSLDSNPLMVIQYYSEILKDIGRRDLKKEQKNKSLSKSPTYQQIEMKEVQTQERSEQQESKAFQRTSRKDLILMELIREKKRKNFAPDYFTIMEMKLMELLEFILQDQSQYLGLDPHTKVREVLRNLESFQGKMIEGESKINLLRIFFEEFTNLKRQKDQLEAMKAYTPMKGLDNRDKREKTPVSTSAKFKNTNLSYKQPKQSYKETTPVRKQNKTKKQANITWIQNQSYVRQQSRPPKPKGRTSAAINDEWIGSL